MIDSGGYGCGFLGFVRFFSLLRRRLVGPVQLLAAKEVVSGSANVQALDQNRFQGANFIGFEVFL